MPKPKEVLKKAHDSIKKTSEKIGDKVDQILSGKHERAENCFDQLSQNNIKICFQSSGQEIANYDQIKDLKIGRIDLVNEQLIEYCLSELRNVGIVNCQTLPVYKTKVEGAIIDAADKLKDALHPQHQTDNHEEL